MKKKRLKLKKWVWVALFLIIFSIAGLITYKKFKEDYELKNSIEYKLSEKGYTEEEITLLKENLTKEAYENLLNVKKKDETHIELFSNSNYKKDLYERYMAYMEKKRLVSVEDAIDTVNLNLDCIEYETGFKADTNLGNEILVNKYFMLDESYVPKDLVKVSVRYCWGDNHMIKKEVYDAFLNMWEEANSSGLYLMINQGYYSYQESEEAYNDAKNSKGEKYADKTYVRPGANDYQTGLSLAIFEKKSSSRSGFKDTEAFAWLNENAFKYGFILRFPEGKETITRRSAEPWHWRYVGPEAAGVIHNNNITLEEYIALYKNK